MYFGKGDNYIAIRDGMGWDARDGTEKSDERRRRKKKRKRVSDRRVMIGGEKK